MWRASSSSAGVQQWPRFGPLELAEVGEEVVVVVPV
jgi:hypothetical protein